MTHGSLFSGIGGFDLAAEWMGWQNIFHCEWNPFGQKVLKHYWPNAISYENICTTDFTIHRGEIDIITGGFPCQPYSTAGKRLGKADERHLFPEMLRCIKEIKPRWIIGENVRGLVSWNGGLVFHEVYDDLEREGYEVQSFLIPAASVNAPHRRDRVWFIANSNSQRHTSCRKGTEAEGIRGEDDGIQKQWSESSEWSNGLAGFQRDASNSNSIRLEQCKNGTEMGRGQTEVEREGSEFANAIETNGKISDTSNSTNKRLEGSIWRSSKGKRFMWNSWKNFPTVSPICNGDDGLSDRLDSVTFSKWRNESIKAGGNAIVPQVAYQIFKTIEQYERIAVTDKNSQTA